MPEIDTSHFECALSVSQEEQFHQDRTHFIKMLRRLVAELGLQDQIEHLKICGPDRGRSELYREPGNHWPSKRLCLDIYPERYMDERLLRHELGHAADRRNPRMGYDPTIEERWKDHWELETAANISLDARLGDGGLGRDLRLKDFRSALGEDHDSVFEEAWANPPKTWPEIEKLAKRLSALQPEEKTSPSACPCRAIQR